MSKTLYLISQNKNNGYDTYDSAVVCAYTEEEAKHMYPGNGKAWDSISERKRYAWAAPEFVTVQYLGWAHASIEIGVVCASFNAG